MEDYIGESQNTTTRERGDSLEGAIEYIFKSANFNTERNVRIAKYEIDVKATIGDRIVIIECKNYQKSNLTIRNLIHQWKSKNSLIGAHKVILAIAGVEINESDYALASDFDIELWSQDDISDLFNLSLKPEELKEKLLKKISFKPLTIDERYRDEITYLVIKPILSGYVLPDEYKYERLNKWLRAFILTELQMEESTTSSDRTNHIHLFEGSKIKKGFLNFKKKREEKDYWFKVYNDLSSEDILSKDIQAKYLSYMDGLLEEYESQVNFFKGDDYLTKARKLISTRLQNSIYFDTDCSFKKAGLTGIINVSFLEDCFEIEVTDISKSMSNTINWIVESENIEVFNEENNISKYYWYFSSFDETVEKVFRILTEYYDLTDKDKIIDITLSSTFSVNNYYSNK